MALFQRLKNVLRQVTAAPAAPGAAIPADLDAGVRATIEFVRPYTMTSAERIAAVCDAARYISRSGIAGAVVECGVWRGGSMMAAARTLLEERDTARDLYLFDTFEGMTEPGAADVSIFGAAAAEEYKLHPEGWCAASLDDVRESMQRVGYPSDRVHLVKGLVEETIPGGAPQQIALLRLDTDWYESTRHELEHLFPRITPGGVLIIDDYGHWQGARKAVDEYLQTRGIPLLLARTDYTGRIAVVPAPGSTRDGRSSIS